jgi:murein DD-endopeptidase MepM/ murein hydrolase activator NlpD
MTSVLQALRLLPNRLHPTRMLHPMHDRFARLGEHVYGSAFCYPAVTTVVLVAVGVAAGAAMRDTVGFAEYAKLQAQAERHDSQVAAAQREVNALAARLGELQAQANRLNALGERLTQAGQLADGEFDFDKPVAIGGAGPVRDMAPSELRNGMGTLERQFDASGRQLSVLESLLFNRKLEAAALPSRAPVAHSYITSGFGTRADPFGGGAQYHKGIDFDANTGDPVLAVADGVVSYAGTRSGYGQVVEVDHGNGYVTRYAHNSRLMVQVGELVRAGEQLAKAGSTGRSTGAHVHFEVWENGHVVNPRKFLGEQSVRRG